MIGEARDQADLVLTFSSLTAFAIFLSSDLLPRCQRTRYALAATAGKPSTISNRSLCLSKTCIRILWASFAGKSKILNMLYAIWEGIMALGVIKKLIGRKSFTAKYERINAKQVFGGTRDR